MAKRKGFPPILCLVFLVFMQSKSCASCSGIPSNFNDVVLNATSLKITAGQVVTITATVPKDNTGAGVSWTSDVPPNPGTFAVTSVTVATYTAPNTVAAKFTVTVTATTLSTTISPPETASITITVNPPPPLKLKTTTLPNGVLGTPYPAGTQLQATGGVPPYQWVPAAGSFPNGIDAESGWDHNGHPDCHRGLQRLHGHGQRQRNAAFDFDHYGRSTEHHGHQPIERQLCVRVQWIQCQRRGCRRGKLHLGRSRQHHRRCRGLQFDCLQIRTRTRLSLARTRSTAIAAS